MNRTAEDLLQELLSLGASRRIEAPGHARIDRAALRTLCAFANEPGQGGGYLLWGLEPVPPDSATPSAPGTGAAPTALTAPAVPCTWAAAATLADQATAPASAVPQAQPAPDVPAELAELPVANVRAFSIDDISTTEIDDAFSVVWLDEKRARDDALGRGRRVLCFVHVNSSVCDRARRTSPTQSRMRAGPARRHRRP